MSDNDREAFQRALAYERDMYLMELEADHMDGDHDGGSHKDCPTCRGDGSEP